MKVQSSENPFASAFLTSSLVFGLIVAASLSVFVSPLLLIAAVAGAVLLWTVVQYPTAVLGALLAFMPIDYMAIELGKFFGFPHMSLVSACTKEIPLLLLTLVLWRRNGFKLAAPDWFLLILCAIATTYTFFGGTWASLALDLNFVLPYFVGRMTLLKEEQARKWATRAVWIVGILAVLGMIEVFILGEGPRALLYVSTDAMTENGKLSASFHATGFDGLREAATMVGPNGFGALCLIGLILWWVYCRNPLPAGMIAAGLVCSLTRSAWLGTGVVVPLLAFIANQQKRFFLCAALGLALFAASVPILGLGDYLFVNKTGQDLSAEGHRSEIVNGLKYVAEHPLGSGNAKLSRLVLQDDPTVTIFETTYPSLAAEYGIPALVCFVGFLFSALTLAWRQKSHMGFAAVGILVGMSVVMAVTLPLDDRRLACWALFPIGLAVRSGTVQATEEH